MEKVGDELSSTIKTQAASMEELHNLLQRDATENANRFTALEGALKTEHQSNFDAMIEKKFNDIDNKLQVALDGQSNSFHNLLTSKFREEIQTLVRTTAHEHSDQQASKFNSLCDTNAAIIMELTDDCSRHLREDVKTQFRKQLNTFSAATKAECTKARKDIATAAQVETEKARAECKAAAFKVVEDIKLDFSEDIVSLQYRCDNIADTVRSLQTPPERSFTPFRLTYKPGQLEWITLAECNNDLS